MSGAPNESSAETTDRRIASSANLQGLAFDQNGLVPVVVQDAADGRVLMVAWANRGALEATLESGLMHFWSRSRRALWRKGETSGNTQAVVSLHADCDGDTVLARVTPAGPACHTGEETCFGTGSTAGRAASAPVSAANPSAPTVAGPPSAASALADLWETVEARDRDRPEGSYTTRLLQDENLRMKKLGEEVAELIAALARRESRAASEAADLVYHLLVALKGGGVEWREVEEELVRRRG